MLFILTAIAIFKSNQIKMKKNVKTFKQFERMNEQSTGLGPDEELGVYDDDLDFSPRQQEYRDMERNNRDQEYRDMEGRLRQSQSTQAKGVIIWNPDTLEIEVMFGDRMNDQVGFEQEKQENPNVQIHFVEFMNDSSSIRTTNGNLDLEDVKILMSM
jgi:hypothetical protein